MSYLSYVCVFLLPSLYPSLCASFSSSLSFLSSPFYASPIKLINIIKM